ncbi:MAG: leucine-rich repeat protein, partial [Muribaculaceae bacterium]|nr:leucine-rich repeat protein [Muribaculaceae bacterium]
IGKHGTTIASNAFSGCSGLKHVEFADIESLINMDFKSIYSNPLYMAHLIYIGEEEIKEINIAESVTSIRNYTFAGCSNLEKITLPGSIREIGESAFNGCSGLKTINVINPIPPVVENSTFTDCPATASLYIPEGSLGLYWLHPYWSYFKNISNLNLSTDFNIDNLTYHITSEADATVEVSASNLTKSDIISLTVPSEVTYNNKVYSVAGIANNGFNGAGLTSLSLPESISYIGIEAFKNNNLTEITCMATIPPSVNENSFDNSVFNSARLIVLKNDYAAYSNHEVWSKFESKVGMVYAKSLSISPEKITAKEGDDFVYMITATIEPDDATILQLNWSSSDESIATVDQQGGVTALSVGECIITAHTTDGSNLQAECIVIVTSKTGVDTILYEGEDHNTAIEVYDINGIYLGDSLETLQSGTYIVRRGNNVLKICK